MKYSLLFFYLFIFLPLFSLEAKNISIVIKDADSERLIEPDKIRIISPNTQQEWEIIGGEIDFDELTGIPNVYISRAERAYPNPCLEKINFDIYLDKHDIYLVRIIDICGNILYDEDHWLQNGVNILTFNTSFLSHGKYFLSVQNDVAQKNIAFHVVGAGNYNSTIEMLSSGYSMIPKKTPQEVYIAKIYASGYEVFTTEINLTDFDDNEELVYVMNAYDTSLFKIIDLKMQMHFSTARFLSQTYDANGMLVHDEDVGNVEADLTVKSKLNDSLHLHDSYIYFQQNESDSTLRIMVSLIFNNTGKIYFRPLEYYIEDGQINIEITEYDFVYAVSRIDYKVESQWEDTGSMTTTYTQYIFDNQDIEAKNKSVPATLSFKIE